MRIVKMIVVFLLLSIIVYMLFAIAEWNINPKDWLKLSRLFMAFVGIPLAGIMAIIYGNWKEM